MTKILVRGDGYGKQKVNKTPNQLGRKVGGQSTGRGVKIRGRRG